MQYLGVDLLHYLNRNFNPTVDQNPMRYFISKQDKDFDYLPYSFRQGRRSTTLKDSAWNTSNVKHIFDNLNEYQKDIWQYVIG